MPSPPATSPPAPPASDKRCFIIGTADPGTARPGTMFFTKRELHDLVDSGKLLSILVWFEHGDQWKDCVGRVVYAWVDECHGLKVVIAFDNLDLASGAIFEWIKSGVFRGLSLGYTATVDKKTYEVTQKRVDEVSIVQTPFHPTCRIDTIVPDGVRAVWG